MRRPEATRQCYVTSVWEINVDFLQLSMPHLEFEPRRRLAPVEELMLVELEHKKR